MENHFVFFLRRTPRPRQDVRLQHHVPLLCQLRLPVQLPHAQPVRGRHHGQLWLPDQGQLHPRRPPPGRVHQDLGRVWPERRVSLTACRIFIIYFNIFLFDLAVLQRSLKRATIDISSGHGASAKWSESRSCDLAILAAEAFFTWQIQRLFWPRKNLAWRI